MKFQPGFQDYFLSPVSGKILNSGLPSLTTNYIWIGNRSDNAIQSPAVIDIRLELSKLRNRLRTTTFILQTDSEGFDYSQALDELDPGMLKQTEGVISIAIAGTDYYSPGHPTYITDTYGASTYNVGVGTNNFQSLSSGIQNLAFGDDALFSITSGNFNIGFSTEALYKLTSGIYNVGIGVQSLYNLVSGSFNVGVGPSTFLNMTSSNSNNTAVGYSAGSEKTTYNQCCFFGQDADASANNLTNSMAFGYNASVGTSNTIVLGNTAITTLNIPGLNFSFTANTITSSNTNGNIVIAPNGTGAVQLNNGSNVTPLQFYNSAGTHYVAFQAGTLTANTTWTLPRADSSGTEALVSDGSGNLSFSAFMGTSLLEGNIWIGNSDNIATPQPTIAITNLPDLTSGNIWRGDSMNRPEESADLSNLENTVSDLQTQVDNLQTQVDGIQTQVDGLETDIATINTEIAAINTEIAAIQAELVVIAGEIVTLQAQVTALEAAVAVIQGQILVIDAQIAALQTYVQSITLTDFVIGGPPDPTTGVITTSRGPTCLLTNIPAGGNVNIGSHQINNLITPIIGTDGANKQYVDDSIAAGAPLVLTGAVTGSGTGTVATTLSSSINVSGASETFLFGSGNQTTYFDIQNQYTPTSGHSSFNNFILENVYGAGFKFSQISSVGDYDSIGILYLNIYNPNIPIDQNVFTISYSSAGSDITFQGRIDFTGSIFNVGGSATFTGIIAVPTPTLSPQAANKGYVDSSIAAGAPLVLTGAVTGSGTGTVATTLSSSINVSGASETFLFSGNQISSFQIQNSLAPTIGNPSYTNLNILNNTGGGYQLLHSLSTTNTSGEGLFQLNILDNLGGQHNIFNVTSSGGVFSLAFSVSSTFNATATFTTSITVPTPSSGTQAANKTYVDNSPVTLSGAVSGSGILSSTISTSYSSIVPINYGGTNAATASAALTNLGALPIAGGTMTGNLILNADPTASLGAVTKQYADAISQGLTFKDACSAASTANLNATYVNGVSGVGATLTNAGSLAAFSLDGTSGVLNARYLIKNQTTAYQNGIYVLTTLGSGAIAYILTRSSDYNTPSEIAPGDLVLINNGTVNANSSWVETATVNTIGTDSISFSQFGNAAVLTAPYILQTSVAALPNAQALGSLSTGLVKNTTTTGVLSIAAAGTDYYSPGHPTYITDTYGASTYNVSLGTNNFQSITSGAQQNLAVGDNALFSITSGKYNTALNNEALYNLTTGTYNVAIGGLSMFYITTDSFNVGVGNATFLNMTSTTSSQNNTAVGYSAGSGKTTYNQCCFFGSGADASANNLTNSMAFGYNVSVGTSNTIVLGNTAITTLNIPGLNFSFTANTITSSNTNGNIVIAPNGTGAVQLNNGSNVTPLQFYNSAGTHYVAFQAGTLTANTTWTLPTTDSTGTQGMVSNGSGVFSWKTIGNNTAKYILQTSDLSLPNAQALGSLSTGLVKNTTTTGILSIAAAGTDYYSPGNPTYITDTYGALTYNVGVGTNNFQSLSSGTQNLAVGDYALFSITSGNYNTALNIEALYHLTTGTYNVAIGGSSLLNITTDSFNVGVGNATFLNMTSTTSSQNNTAVGYSAGSGKTTYNQCCFFGSGADASANNLTNSMAFGYNVSVGTSNTIVLGNTAITTLNIPGLNFSFTANTITSSNTNGNIVITPNGTGIISLSSNVGVGTTTANSALQFANNVNYRTITLYEVTNNSYQYYGFGLQPNTIVYNVSSTSGVHAFYAGTSSSTSKELLRITATGTTSNSGCVGINVGATPSAGCHVIGGVQNISGEDTCFRAQSSSTTAKMEFNNTAGSGRLYEVRSTNTGNWDVVDRTGSAERLVVNTTGVGIFGSPDTNLSVTTGSADKPGGGSWGSFSDVRIKNKVRDYTHGLKEILQITPKIYQYSEASKLRVDDLHKDRIGIIAQDIENILPECIELMEAKGFSDLRYYDSSPILYTLINAVKELSQEINHLKSTIH